MTRGHGLHGAPDIIDWARQIEDAVKDELADNAEKIEDAEARVAEEDDPMSIAAAAAANALSARGAAPAEPVQEPDEVQEWVQCSACSKCAPHNTPSFKGWLKPS